MTRDLDAELIAEAPCGLLVTDADDAIVRVNDTFLAWVGASEADVLGTTFSSLLSVGDQALYASQFQDGLWATPEALGVSATLVRADGTRLPIILNARKIIDGTAVTGVRLAVFDATTRHDLEREMLIAKRAAEESEAGVRILQDAGTQFLLASDEQQLAAQVVSIVKESFAAYDAAVSMYLDADGTFRIVEGRHLSPLLNAIRASRGNSHRPLEPEQLIIAHDIEDAYSRSQEVGDYLRHFRAASFIALPITDGVQVIGAIAMIFGRARPFDEPTLDLYRALSRAAALAFSRVRLIERLQGMATRDNLTGLANRAAIDDRIAESLDASRRDGSPTCLIFIDLDGFKEINDSSGHAAGDLMLQSVATRLLAEVRGRDVVGRFGGDEFVVVCEDADLESAQQIADRLASAISKPIAGSSVTASMGIAMFDPAVDQGETVASFTRRADAAMYESKRDGRNRTSISYA